MWSKQRAILESIRDHRRTAVPSGHGVGKTHAAAVAACHWIATHPPGEAFVITTAPTFSQVRAVLWRELHRVHQRGRLAGELNQTEWLLNGELVALGRSPADYNQTALQGIHARYVLALIDEACGVAEPIWQAVSSLATTEGSRICALGNPDDATGAFAKACAPASGWNVIPISVFDSPNFTSEAVPVEVGNVLTGSVYVDDAKRDFGESSPIYASKVLGRFPEDDPTALIPLSWAMRAAEAALDRGEPVELGVDVARAGQDSNEIYCRWGPVARRVWGGHEPDTMRTVARVAQAIAGTGATAVKIDTVGVGGGVHDALKADHQPVREYDAGAAPRNRERFRMRRDEDFWALRERFETGDIDIDPSDELLIAQLTSIRWDPTPRGQVAVESKDHMKARGLKSPDRADALAMCFAASTRKQVRVL